MKISRASLIESACLFLTLALSGQQTIRAADLNPDLRDPEQLKAEFKKIQEQDKGDKKKLLEDLKALNKAAAKALGMEAQYAEHQRLLTTYGPLGSRIILGAPIYEGINQPPREPDHTIDTDAWRVDVKVDGNAFHISAYLDRKRYAGVKPKEVLIVLREKDVNIDHEMEAIHAPDSTKSFRVPVRYDLSDDGVYTMTVVAAPAERGRYLLQIYADIEPYWATAAFIPLEARWGR